MNKLGTNSGEKAPTVITDYLGKESPEHHQNSSMASQKNTTGKKTNSQLQEYTTKY